MITQRLFLCVIFLVAQLTRSSEPTKPTVDISLEEKITKQLATNAKLLHKNQSACVDQHTELSDEEAIAKFEAQVAKNKKQIAKNKELFAYFDFSNGKSPHRAQPIFDYIRDQNSQKNKKLLITFANAHDKLQKKFGFGYAETYSFCYNYDSWSVLFKVIATIPDIQTKILEHMGLRTKEVQDSFFHTPLDKALLWYSSCVHSEPLILIDLDTRFLLTCDQYNCLASIVHTSTKQPKSKRYVDEARHKSICVFLTAKAKNILLSLPQEFVADEEAAATLKNIMIAEEPSKLSKIVKTPLAMFFHSMRTPPFRETATFQQIKVLMPSRIGCSFIAMIINRLFCVNNPAWFAIFSTIAVTGTLQSLHAYLNYYDSDGNPQCIVPTTMGAFKEGALCFCIVPGFLTLSNTTKLHPTSAIFPMLNAMSYTLALGTMFALWDFYKYGAPKYAVKTESIAQLIAANKKQRPQQSSCALL